MSGERHIPVMLDEVVAALKPASGERMVDGTFGAGGYSRALLERGAHVTGFDQDPDVIRDAAPMLAEFEGRLDLVHAPFSRMDEHFEAGSIDGVVLDIGVSSMQIDQAERGFSFQKDGPLDMRMAQSGLSAADAVNTFAVSDLTRIIGILGEERHAGRVARAIEKERALGPIETTAHLAKIVEKAVGRGPKDKIHPATRTFQALRISVNDELGALESLLKEAPKLLLAGGRLAIITYHSLEDRMVKQAFVAAEEAGSLLRLTKKVVKPSDDEISRNPRARTPGRGGRNRAIRSPGPDRTGGSRPGPDLPRHRRRLPRPLNRSKDCHAHPCTQ